MIKKLKGIYIIQFENKGIKFGMSVDIMNRINVYMSPWSLKIERLVIVTCPYPKNVEDRIKKSFNNNIKGPSLEFITNVNFDSILEYTIKHRESRDKLFYPMRSFKFIVKQLIPEGKYIPGGKLNFEVDNSSCISINNK